MVIIELDGEQQQLLLSVIGHTIEELDMDAMAEIQQLQAIQQQLLDAKETEHVTLSSDSN